MQRTFLSVIILLTIMGASAAAWWAGSADDRRMSECRQRGVEDQSRLARCARGSKAQAAVFAEERDERRAEIQRRVRMRLAEVRSSNRSEVNKHQYKPVSLDALLDAYGVVTSKFWYERTEIPAQTEERHISVGGVILSGDFPDDGFPKIYLSVSGTLRDAVEADIERLERVERQFIWKVCTSFYVRRVFGREGCPVVAYGQVAFKSLLLEDDWLDPAFGTRDFFFPVFEIEAVEFLDPPQP